MPDAPTDERTLLLCRGDELDAILEGRARGYDPQGTGQDSVFVVRHQGRLHAWRNACPHIEGAPMAWRKDAYMNAAGTHIVCSAHGALFDPANGICSQGPCVGRALTRVELNIRSDGQVVVRNY
mgnify:FL=1